MPTAVLGLDMEQIIKATKNDKKMDGGTIRFILLQAMGQAVIDSQVTEEEMRQGLLRVLE